MQDHFINQIDDYILGRLSGDALQSFEQELQQNMEFRKTVQEQQDALNYIEAANDLLIQEQISAIHAAELKELNKKSESNNRFKPIAIAASVAIFIAASIWLLDIFNTEENLHTAYYDVPTIAFTDRGENTATAFEEAGFQYNSGNYQKAIEQLEALLPQVSQNPKAHLALGISYFEIKKFPQAIQHFDWLMNNGGDLYAPQGKWYKALSMLSLGQNMEAEKLLKEIESSGGWKSQEAQKILNQQHQ